MKLLNKTEIEVKKSRFIAYLYKIDDKKEIGIIYDMLKKEHKKARHIPYACILTNTASKSDDKEPSGTSGLPIYQVLERQNTTNIAIFFFFFYEGVALEPSVLTRVYRASAASLFPK